MWNTLNRREWLLLSGGCCLSWLAPALPGRAAERRGAERHKSLLTIWLGGGPSQLETWDPHPGTKIGGPTRDVETSQKDVRIAADYPRVAEILQHLTVVRSLVSKEGDHERGTYMVRTGYRPEQTVVHPSLGSIVSKVRPNPQLEIPQHVSLGNAVYATRGGYLGDQYDAFRVFNPGRNLQNLEAGVDAKRQTRRLEDLQVVSGGFMKGREVRVEKSLHQHTVEAALRMMKSDQLAAFEIKDESEATQQAYGKNPFGQACLVARRLIEQGVRAVEVNLQGFDTHANNFELHSSRAAELDPALSALVKDLRDRDLYDSTAMLVIGEFGRTPNVNPLDGRDHWPNGFSCLLGGGGLKTGVTIGATDPTGAEKMPTDPVGVSDLTATILRVVGVDETEEVITPIGRPIRYSSGKPLDRLMA